MPSHAVVLATRLALEAGNTLSDGAVARVRRSLESLATLGIRHVAVVDGRHAEPLRERLAQGVDAIATHDHDIATVDSSSRQVIELPK